MFKKILYAGSGDDTNTLTLFPNSDFICIDSLPRNAYGYPYYYRGFYQTSFKTNIIKKLKRSSFSIKNEKKYSDFYSEINVPNLDSHRVIFEKENKILHYYFSTGIPENLYDGNGDLNIDLVTDIKECDTLLIKGHWPHQDLMLYTKNPIHFIGAHGTYFPENKRELEEDKEYNNVIHYIFSNPSSVSSYSFLNKQGEITTFQTYPDFYKFYKNSKVDDEEDTDHEKDNDYTDNNEGKVK